MFGIRAPSLQQMQLNTEKLGKALDAVQGDTIQQQDTDLQVMQHLTSAAEQVDADLKWADDQIEADPDLAQSPDLSAFRDGALANARNVHQSLSLLADILVKEKEMGELIAQSRDRIAECQSLLRDDRTPTAHQASRIHRALDEVAEISGQLAEGNAALVSAHKEVASLVGSIDVRPRPDLSGPVVKMDDGQVVIDDRKDLISGEPGFAPPGPVANANQLNPGLTAAPRLDAVAGRALTGLAPGSEVDGAKRSDDDKVNSVVSVNVLRVPADLANDDGELSKFVDTLMTNRARGPLSVALENRGDGDLFVQNVDQNLGTLSARLYGTAIYVIDPATLTEDDRKAISSVNQGVGGANTEIGIGHRIGASSIAAVIVSGHSAGDAGSLPTVSVGDTQSAVHYNRGDRDLNLRHPDYASGIKAVLQANPDKTLLFHISRF